MFKTTLKKSPWIVFANTNIKEAMHAIRNEFYNKKKT